MQGKRKLLAAMGTMALAALLISAGTFALFTDAESNEGNTFAAGTVSISDITNGDGSAAINLDNLAPGDNTTGEILEVAPQVATLSGQMSPNFINWCKIAPWLCDDKPDPDPDPVDESTHNPATLTIVNDGSLDAWVQLSDVVTSGVLFEGENPIVIGTEADPEDPIMLEPGEEREYTVHWAFPLKAGNEYQGGTGEATFHFEAVQSDNNTNEEGDGPNSWNEDAS